MLIISDGLDTSSNKYCKTDTKQKILEVEQKYNWNVLFCGANIDTYEQGKSMSIKKSNCFEYEQAVKGDLLSLCRSISECVSDQRVNNNNINLTREKTVSVTKAEYARNAPTDFQLQPLPPLPPLGRM